MPLLSVLMPFHNRRGLLINTLESFEHFYGDEIEVLIFDDGSEAHEDISDLAGNWPFSKRVFGWEGPSCKKGLNPCILYNYLAHMARGEYFLLTSPEVMHLRSIFKTTDNLSKMNDNTYGICSCWNVPVDNTFLRVSMSRRIGIALDVLTESKVFGHDNSHWYQHSIYNNRGFHFCNIIPRSLFFGMRGFDERYRDGVSYDDVEFIRRVKEYEKANIVYYDDFEALHIAHPHSSEQMRPELSARNNDILQFDIENNIYHVNNESWGILEGHTCFNGNER
jgi:hypothetical protein